jgi:uncharacterized membrane protein YvbJ
MGEPEANEQIKKEDQVMRLTIAKKIGVVLALALAALVIVGVHSSKARCQ